ncbi:hypothetical protein Acr_00g0031830 [Actinidia rufa]|uniref:Uncharacterized protein n=1 Tax=Actinidia rufa TaxID=165716 RepID=A0A7J0DH39_9ERIC|nr:hypothetical protein Acr_00g0031830 [Actinidia rufa]
MSFKRVEEKEVDGVVKACRVDYHRTPSLNLDGVSKRIIEKLISKNTITTMPWQNWDQTSKVIIIDTYMMLEKLAPILKALLEKYGDFQLEVQIESKSNYDLLDGSIDVQFATDQLARVVKAHFGLHSNHFVWPNFAGVDDEIAKQCAVVDSEDEVVDPMVLSITKLSEEVEELEKKMKGT